MYAPSYACKLLARYYPECRLAWHGLDREPGEDVLNKGTFCLIELAKPRAVGTIDDPKTIHTFWDVETFYNPAYGFHNAGIDRGPIFAKDGSLHRDWSATEYTPVIGATFNASWHYPSDGKPVETQDLFNGRFMEVVHFWLSNSKKRKREAKEQEFKRRRDMISDNAGQFLDVLTSNGKRDGSYLIKANKHMKWDGDWDAADKAASWEDKLKKEVGV